MSLVRFLIPIARRGCIRLSPTPAGSLPFVRQAGYKGREIDGYASVLVSAHRSFSTSASQVKDVIPDETPRACGEETEGVKGTIAEKETAQGASESEGAPKSRVDSAGKEGKVDSPGKEGKIDSPGKEGSKQDNDEASSASKDAARKKSEEEAVQKKAEEDKKTAQKKAEEERAVLRWIADCDVKMREKQKQLAELKEREVTSMAELENVRERLRRESDGTRKYAIQDFAKSLLDVADNLGRALATIPENTRKEIVSDLSETAKFLKSLLEGLTVTEKELMKVLKDVGVEKFEPLGQPFDPNSHLALFEVPDPSKGSGTVAMCVKAGYMLHDRVLRPAEVGVVKTPE